MGNLNASLRPLVELVDFTWRRSLLGRFDLIHIHWPEYLLRSSRGPKRAVLQVGFALLLLRLLITGTPGVATMHNERPHENGGPLETALIAAWLRLARVRIYMTRAAAKSNQRSIYIPHGHYGSDLIRLATATPREEQPVPTLLHFGVIRRYKGIDALIDCMEQAQVEGLQAHLRVVGNPLDLDLASRVAEKAEEHPWFTSRLEFTSEHDLHEEILASDGVVLPYAYLYNSGAMLLALTLRRPVLVPSSPTAEETADEVGRRWVQQYEPPLTAAHLEAFAADVRRGLEGMPDLSARDWPALGRQHLEAFKTAARRRRSERTTPDLGPSYPRRGR